LSSAGLCTEPRKRLFPARSLFGQSAHCVVACDPCGPCSMETHVSSKLFALLVGCGVIVSIAAMPVTSIARPKTPLSTVKCECECAVATENPSVSQIEDKTFAAPGGDPKACGGLNGTKCRSSGGGEGKLQKCEGVVERKMPPTGTTVDDLQVNPGTPQKPKVPKQTPSPDPQRN
jgi:hypothetical protein